MREENSKTDTTRGHNKTMKVSLVPRLFISHIVWIFLVFIKLNIHNRKTLDSCRYKPYTKTNCIY